MATSSLKFGLRRFGRRREGIGSRVAHLLVAVPGERVDELFLLLEALEVQPVERVVLRVAVAGVAPVGLVRRLGLQTARGRRVEVDADGAQPLVARVAVLELGVARPGRARLARLGRADVHRRAFPALRHLAQALDLQLIRRLQKRLQTKIQAQTSDK